MKAFYHSSRQAAFTIVELLIVIVVIAILASITVVAYNGIQQRAQNVQTSQALSNWVKALKLYKADRGQWPAYGTCLGSGYLYGPAGTATTGTAQCRQNDAGSVFTENAAFKAAMAPYIGTTLPNPAFITARASDTNWRRGLSYLYGGGGDGTAVYIEAAYAGVLSSCPSVDGVTGTNLVVWNGNTYCYFGIGTTTE